MNDVDQRLMFERIYRENFKPENHRLFSRLEDGFYAIWSVEVAWRCFKQAQDLMTSQINDMAAEQWKWVEAMGWHNKQPLEYLALIASEVGEAVNECRGDKPTEDLGSELADIVLRTIDMAHHFKIDIYREMRAKMVINQSRGTRGRAK